MTDKKPESAVPGSIDGASSTAVKEKPKSTPRRTPPKQLPPYKVILHNDDINTGEHVVLSILKLTSLTVADAELKMREADRTGLSVLLVTHRERAELYEEQFRSFNLTVTIEPDA